MLAQRLRPSSTSLSILAGDWNWVANKEDRTELEGGTHTGDRDELEEKHWHEVSSKAAGMFEWHQSGDTYASPGSRSRIDRVYSN